MWLGLRVDGRLCAVIQQMNRMNSRNDLWYKYRPGIIIIIIIIIRRTVL